MHFFELKYIKYIFSRSSKPDPAGGVYDAPSDSLVGWGGGYPSLHPLDDFDISISQLQTVPRFSVVDLWSP